MRSETELFKDKIEVSLDSRQVFYLFSGGAVIAALVFVLGVMVGKRVEARAHTESTPATSAASDPLAALDRLSQRDELAFPSALAGKRDEPLGRVDAVLEAKAAPKPTPHKNSKSSKTLNKKSGAKHSKAAAPKPAAPEPAAAPAPGGDEKPAAADGNGEKPKPDQGAQTDKPAAQADKPKPRFTLQLSSFRDRAEADSFYTKLKDAGYSPYVVEAEVPDKGTWYRVRLGRYDSYDAAVDAKKEFEDSQHVIAYVTRLKS